MLLVVLFTKPYKTQYFENLLLGCPWGAPGGLPGELLEGAWKRGAPESLLGVSWPAPGELLGTSWGAPVQLLETSWEAPGGVLETPRVVLESPRNDPEHGSVLKALPIC